MTVVELTEILLKRKSAESKKALEALMASSDPDAIIKFIVEVILAECEIGLGLMDWDDDDELKFFNQINDVYQEAAGDCYFCRELDPNEIKFDKNTQLCMTCQLKMRNFLRAIGIEPGKVLVSQK